MATATTGLATSFIQFSRPSASGGGATVTDRDGKIKWAGHNLVQHSESLDNSYWTRTQILSLTANAAAAPNGTTTADLMIPNTTTQPHGIYMTGSGSATELIHAVFVKANGYTKIGLREANVSGAGAAFDLSGSGSVIGVYDAGGGTVTNPTITPLANSWFLISCKIAFASATAQSLSVHVLSPSYSAGGNIYASWAANGTDGIYAWGAHLYRSDLAGMQGNPAMPAGMGSYYPTTPRNLVGYSEDFSAASWARTNMLAFGSGSVANAVVNPVTGIQTADLIVENTTNGAHLIGNSPAVTTVSGGTLTLSIYAKAAGRNHIALYEGTTAKGKFFNLSAGTVGGNLVGAPVSAAIAPLGDGWYRCSIVVAAGASAVLSVYFSTDGTTFSYTGDGTSGIYLWGAQLSDSASLDAYSPVYGAAVTSAAYYAPRLDFDSSGVARGLLVEEARTNIVLHSNDFSQAAWTKINGGAGTAPTVTSGQADPWGGTTAWRIQADAGSTGAGAYSLVRQTISSVTSPRTIWIKSNTGSNQSVALGPAETGAVITATSTWTRISISPTSTNPIFDIGSYPVGTGNTTQSVDVLIWGAQVETAGGSSVTFMTSYIPTGSATATRAADVASVSTGAFPYSASEGTIVVNVANARGGAVVGASFATFDDGNGGYDNAREIYLQGANGDIIAFEASSSVTAVNSAVIYDGPTGGTFTGKVAYAYKSNDFDASYSGNAAASLSTSGTPAANISRMGIGTSFPASATGLTGGQLHIRQVTYIPRKLSDAELAARSA